MQMIFDFFVSFPLLEMRGEDFGLVAIIMAMIGGGIEIIKALIDKLKNGKNGKKLQIKEIMDVVESHKKEGCSVCDTWRLQISYEIEQLKTTLVHRSETLETNLKHKIETVLDKSRDVESKLKKFETMVLKKKR